jgi:uncharacterized membrane protein
MADRDLGGNKWLDDQLTDGYARALAIETECRRTVRRIAAAGGDAVETSEDVKQLATKLAALRAELKALRAELDQRRRAADPYGRRY